MKHHIFISLLIFLGLLGCKNAPTFSPDNELDPGSKYYPFAVPFNIQVEFGYDDYTSTDDVLIIQWDYPRSEQYIKEFKLFRSDTDSSDFKEIGLVSKDSRRNTNGPNYTYYFIDDIEYNGINVWYKIQAIMDQNYGTLYTESKPFSYSAPDFEINASIQPFIANPVVTLEWQYTELTDDVRMEIYSNTNLNDEFELVLSDNISNNSTSFSLDIHQPVETEYFYKLVLNEIQSDYIPIPTSIIRPTLDILDSSVFFENNAELHIGLKQDSSGFDHGNFLIENYELEVLYAPKNDTSQYHPFQEINEAFSTKNVKKTINSLQQENIYLFRLKGSRGNYKTVLTSKLLNHKFHIVNTSSFNAETNEIIFPNGSFNSFNSHFIASSGRRNPIIVDVQNAKVDPLITPNQHFELRSAFGNHKNTNDAIITSSSAGHVLVWSPASKKLLITIPNFREEIQSSVNFHPVDFDVISEEELLIAYGDVDSQKGSVNSYYVTIWNSTTETHKLIYQVHEESMYSYQFKVAYYDNTILIFYAHEMSEVKLVALNKNDLLLQKQTSFSSKIDAWNPIDIHFSNAGEQAFLYTKDEAIQIQLDNHEIISSVSDVHPKFGWYNIRGFATAKDFSLTCYGGDYWYHSFPFYSQIRCSSNLLHEADILDISMEGYLNGLILSDDGTKLGAVFHEKIAIYTFKNDWVLNTIYE